MDKFKDQEIRNRLLDNFPKEKIKKIPSGKIARKVNSIPRKTVSKLHDPDWFPGGHCGGFSESFDLDFLREI